MIMLLIDAVLLIAILKLVNDDEIGFLPAVGLALVSSIASSAIIYMLASQIGILPGIFVGLILNMVGLMVAIFALFDMTFGRAAIAGFGYFVADLIIRIMLVSMMTAA